MSIIKKSNINIDATKRPALQCRIYIKFLYCQWIDGVQMDIKEALAISGDDCVRIRELGTYNPLHRVYENSIVDLKAKIYVWTRK